MRTVFSLWFLGFALLLGQDRAPEVVPVDQEPMHKLVFENEYVRVFSVEVPPGGETKYHRHDRDYVGVILGDADVESVRVGEAAVSRKLKDGEVLFAQGGFAHKAVNKGEKPFRNVTVELKKGSSGSVDMCAAPKQCMRTQEMSGHIISITTTLFTSRQLRAFRHTLSARGSLGSSYYSPNSDDNILIAPLTALNVSLDGVAKKLNAGEPWFGAVREVEVSAGTEDVSWVVLRLTLPPKSNQGGAQ